MGHIFKCYFAQASDFEDKSYLAGAIYAFYEQIVEEVAPDDMAPLCRQAGELALFEASVDDNGLRSYLDRYGWRPRAGEDIVAAYRECGLNESARMFAGLAERLGALTPEDLNAVIFRRTEDLAHDPLSAWLEAQVEALWAQHDAEMTPAILLVEKLRQKGLIKKAVSQDKVDAEIERILERAAR